MTDILYFDCFSGISGNMIIGALLDIGVSAEALEARLKTLPLENWSLSVSHVRRGPFRATHCEVVQSAPAHDHRHLGTIEKLIDAAELPGRVIEKAKQVFRVLADAEGAVHGIAPEKVGFHEVGAVDAIVDIVGACTALDLLGWPQVACAPMRLGQGQVSSMHGEIPVPAPATVALLSGVPVKQLDTPFEMTTPTGAALMKVLAHDFGCLPDMVLEKTGYGAGSERATALPNVLRAMTGSAAGSGVTADAVMVLETNLDNVPAEDTGYVLEALMAKGALDAFLTPITMKKSRLGQKLTVLCRPGDQAGLEKLIFLHLPTLGIRSHAASRHILNRRQVPLETPWGTVRIKVSESDGALSHATIEYEDLKKAAQETGLGLDELRKKIMALYLGKKPAQQ